MTTTRSLHEQMAAWLRQFGPRFGRDASLRDLDERTLADIGVHPSEIGSIDAESRGTSGVTRLRIAREPRHA